MSIENGFGHGVVQRPCPQRKKITISDAEFDVVVSGIGEAASSRLSDDN